MNLVLFMFWVLVACAGVGAQEVFITYNSTDDLDQIDRNNGGTLGTKNLTLVGFSVSGTNGLALHPVTAVVHAVVRVSTGALHLCTVNRATGACSSLGVFTDTVSSIAFDDTGTLYAVTADNAAQPETLFTVNLTTAALTLVVALGNGDLGEAIAFNPVNGLMYHTSGFSAPIAYETIDLTTLAVAPAGTLNANDTYSAFFYDAATSNFVAGTLGARYGTIGVAGGFSQINSTMSSSIRGIVIVPPVVPTVLSSTQNLNLGTTTAGTAGAAVNFTVEGFQLSANLTVTAFPGVQVSLMAATGYGASVSLVPAAGTVATTTVYARISSGTAQGAVAGNIVVTSTGANTINIAANGQVDPVPVAEINVMRAAIAIADGAVDTLGTQTAGMPLNVQYTIQNLGNQVLNLTGIPRVLVTAGANLTSASVAVQPAATVGGGASVNFTVNYNVTTTGPFSFTVSIDNDDLNENPYNWTVNGTGQGAPEMDMTRAPATIGDGGADALGSRAIGAIILLTYEISNLGTDVLSITPPVALANITGCNVTVTMQPGTTVAMAATTQVALSVVPTALGAFSVEVSIVNNDADENPYNWTISGTGFGLPEISVASAGVGIPDGGTDPIGAGNTAGQAITRTYNISNIGNAPLTITLPVTVVGPGNCVVSVTTQPSATVAPSATTQLVLSVTPSGAGTFNYGVSFVNNDADESPYNFNASGAAVAGGGGSGSGGNDAGGGCAAGSAMASPLATPLVAALLARRRRKS
jgi:hypothetical protein